MYKTDKLSIIFFPLAVLFAGCHSFERAVEVTTNLDYFENNVNSVLFQTEPGCSKTNFEFNDAYYELEINRYNNCFTASNINEFENTIKKYFAMDYFQAITPEFFKGSVLVIVILSANDGEYYKNGQFKKGDDNKFIYNIELWDNGKPDLFRTKCSYIKAFVLNLGKNNK